MPPRPPTPPSQPAGLGARRLAVALLEGVLDKRHTLEEALAASGDRPFASLSIRDRAFARAIATAVLRRRGSLEHVLAAFLNKPLPKDAARAHYILLAAAAQLLLLEAPPHAVINLAVEQCRRDRLARRFDKLTNAVLRRVANDGPRILAGMDSLAFDVPDWLMSRWSAHYGEETARAIAGSSLREAPLDLTVRSDSATWAARLGGDLLAGGSVRLPAGAKVDELPGYSEGAWWVQDAAAALPARLIGPLQGRRVADLCAAPGGKTAQLAAAGANVIAVDQSARRLEVVRTNLARLRLQDAVELIEADLRDWRPGESFDAVLLDAPCTATGTIRRHPDILYQRTLEDVERLSELQARLLEQAVTLIKPGGIIVYCTCSLEPEEGESQVDRILGRHFSLSRVPIDSGEIWHRQQWVTRTGDLRTLPCHNPGDDTKSKALGMDGFYAARLRRHG